MRELQVKIVEQVKLYAQRVKKCGGKVMEVYILLAVKFNDFIRIGMDGTPIVFKIVR